MYEHYLCRYALTEYKRMENIKMKELQADYNAFFFTQVRFETQIIDYDKSNHGIVMEIMLIAFGLIDKQIYSLLLKHCLDNSIYLGRNYVLCIIIFKLEYNQEAMSGTQFSMNQRHGPS